MTISESIKILEIKEKNIDLKILKKAYKKAVQKWHPDIATRNGISIEDSHETTIKIINAYEYLIDNLNLKSTLNASSQEFDKVSFSDCHILWIKYLKLVKILIVRFEGNSTYMYYDVPKEIFDNYINAENPGRFQYYNVSYSFKYRSIINEDDWINYNKNN